MNTYNNIILSFVERMVNDGYSKDRILRIKGQMRKLSNYLVDNSIDTLCEKFIVSFVKDAYNFDYYNPINANQLDKIKYLKNLLEFKDTGNYLKRHSKVIISNDRFQDEYKDYEVYLNTKDIEPITKQCKLIKARLFFNSLTEINDIKELKKIHCYNFINNLNYSLNYKEEITREIRMIISWLYSNNKIGFDGKSLFPRIVDQSRNSLISYYDNSEIEKILDSVDIDTPVGKRDYLVLSLLIYHGLRVSDVTNLKLSDINWNTNTISIIQQKTKNVLTLPLIDEVKYPLIDYIKNARKNIDSDYILITNYAPYSKYGSKSFHMIITKYMNKAKIDYTNKHHGTHTLRHSLASNLLKDNTPITTISSILGHSTIKTTQKYLTIDVSNLKELSLEVDL